MNATQRAHAAYHSASQPIRTHRGVEYEAFARVTGRMKQHATRLPTGFQDLAKALHDNRRLWSALAIDVADRDNGLPNDLRARIVYLAEFTRLHSSKVLSSSASAEPLIEINMAMMRGLRGTGGAA